MRSKSLLVANILATLYSVVLFWEFIGSIFIKNAVNFIEYQKLMFDLFVQSLGYGASTAQTLYFVIVLLYLNIGLFLLGAIVGWIGLIAKKSGVALFAAIMYLLGTLCFPICVLTGLPTIILGFVGYSKQKKFNNSNGIN